MDEADDLAASDPGVTAAIVESRSLPVFFGLLGVALLTRGTLRTRARSWVVPAAGLMVVVAIDLSRIYLGYHWMTEVTGGWALGDGSSPSPRPRGC